MLEPASHPSPEILEVLAKLADGAQIFRRTEYRKGDDGYVDYSRPIVTVTLHQNDISTRIENDVLEELETKSFIEIIYIGTTSGVCGYKFNETARQSVASLLLKDWPPAVSTSW
jgi:hypothetical protein